MIEIHTATEALTAAQRLLDAQTGAGGADFWQSYSVSPLAAILLTTAHDNAEFADLVAVREVLAVSPSQPDGLPQGWVSIAQRCPDPLLSSTLHRAAGLEPTTARFLLHKRPGSARTLMTFRRNTAPLRRPTTR
ncbi:Tol-Pal system YbgF (modular protein) [uncultured Mycobacterium sp.]|uniref:Uncharacterized protein n=2 Tax=Mycobacteriaceae TaxID=1762 RepID=A0A064CBV8_9MYCO|nr:hypothetical protein [Mycolicibacterium aromaticivorans]KDE97171.1 hypothetical protein Y900_028265 [Mycolicibacterium aromaticivorans JS19b1 = JCM 16368]SBS78345.1 Tol-Pal system YbgF (modular protein) [uncultured Mycobacterium sp.]